MIFYNILIGILAIFSVGLIALGISQRKDLCPEIIGSSITKGILGIVAIISICLSKHLIVDHITLVDLMFNNLKVPIENILVLIITSAILYMYITCLKEYEIKYEIPEAVFSIMYPVLFLALPYIFNYFVK